jgi:hypothetical protein
MNKKVDIQFSALYAFLLRYGYKAKIDHNGRPNNGSFLFQVQCENFVEFDSYLRPMVYLLPNTFR